MSFPSDANLANPNASAGTSRRNALLQAGLLGVCAMVAAPAVRADALLGLDEQQWLPLSRFSASSAPRFPESFTMYLARFLISYDPTVRVWYTQQLETFPPSWSDERMQKEMQVRLGRLGASVAHGLADYDASPAGVTALYRVLLSKYAQEPGGEFQLAVLFSLLPPELQPTQRISECIGRHESAEADASAVVDNGHGDSGDATSGWREMRMAETQGRSADDARRASDAEEVVRRLSASPQALLPLQLAPRWDERLRSWSLPEPLAADGTFGTLSQSPIAKEKELALDTYLLFALAGGLGCSMTHVLVTPIDMVKTRLQTRPGKYKGFVDALATIRKEEGARMLMQGADVTAAGFFMYGIIVYPGYELLKRYFFALAGEQAVLQFRVPLVLAAGALATVAVSFVLTPFEAVRIRMVERPEYAPSATAALSRFVGEGGVASLYSGLLPLMARQVSFGMVKFLIFDYAKDLILSLLPIALREEVAISLGVSLLSGAIAGVVASVVSQPADVVLSKIAERSRSGASQLEALLETSSSLWRELGLGGFFLGLGSRCVFAAAIIAGQFFLYDAFKEGFSVTGSDLTVFYDVLGKALSPDADVFRGS